MGEILLNPSAIELLERVVERARERARLIEWSEGERSGKVRLLRAVFDVGDHTIVIERTAEYEKRNRR